MAFVDVTVVPMDREYVLPKHTVVVKGGRITALGPSQKVSVPAGAVRIDGRGHYLIPGLADMHVHLHPAWYADYDGSPNFQTTADTALADHWLSLFVANGVTTIRNMDYMPDGGRSLRLKARAAAGTLLSPRIYTAGSWTGGDIRRQGIAPESVATYIGRYQAAGYDFIKVRDEPGRLFDSIAAAAQRIGLPIAGHLVGGGRLDFSLKQGQALRYASIEHLDGLNSLRPPGVYGNFDIPAAAAALRRAGIWSTPHMTLFEVRVGEVTPLAWPEMRFLTGPRYQQIAQRMAQMNASQIADTTHTVLSARRRIVKTLQDSGAGLLLGSDTPIVPLVPGFAVYHELAALVRAGLTPYQALAMATKNVGAFFQAQHVPTLSETGTIAVGQRADLVLLAGNPLVDIQHTAKPAGVMLNGQWLTRAALDRRLLVLPYWKFPGPDVEELSLLRAGLTLTATQEQEFGKLRMDYRMQWQSLVDSLRGVDQGQSMELNPVGSTRLLQLAARQFVTYRDAVLAPEQRAVFDPKMRAWLTAAQQLGYSVMLPGSTK